MILLNVSMKIGLHKMCIHNSVLSVRDDDGGTGENCNHLNGFSSSSSNLSSLNKTSAPKMEDRETRYTMMYMIYTT